MSDSSQGPGWWLASDGRWYPPESRPAPRGLPAPQHPQTAQPPPPAPTRDRELTRRLGPLKLWQWIALGAAAVLAVASVVGSISPDDDLIPAHKDMVDTLAEQGDCASLQDRFDDAYDNRGTPGSERHRRNVALMEYADDAMRRIGCYD